MLAAAERRKMLTAADVAEASAALQHLSPTCLRLDDPVDASGPLSGLKPLEIPRGLVPAHDLHSRAQGLKIIFAKDLTYTGNRVYSQMVRGFPKSRGSIRGFTVGSVAVLPRSR